MNTMTHCIERPAGHPRSLRDRLAASIRQAVRIWHVWRERSRSRAELIALSDEMLRDIGVSRSHANFQGSKPFWRA